jgi:hypothetical protein
MIAADANATRAMGHNLARSHLPTWRNPTNAQTHASNANTAKHAYITPFWKVDAISYLTMILKPSGVDDTTNDALCEPTPRDVTRQRFHEQSWSQDGGADARLVNSGAFPPLAAKDDGRPSRPIRIDTLNVCEPDATDAGSDKVSPPASFRKNQAAQSHPTTIRASSGVRAPSESASTPKAISTAFDGVPVKSSENAMLCGSPAHAGGGMFVDASVSTKDATPNGAGPTVFENAVATMHAARISKMFFMAQVYHSSRA